MQRLSLTATSQQQQQQQQVEERCRGRLRARQGQRGALGLPLRLASAPRPRTWTLLRQVTGMNAWAGDRGSDSCDSPAEGRGMHIGPRSAHIGRGKRASELSEMLAHAICCWHLLPQVEAKVTAKHAQGKLRDLTMPEMQAFLRARK